MSLSKAGGIFAALLCGVSSISPAVAQSPQVQQQLEGLQQQNRQLQRQNQELIDRLNGMSDAIKRQQNDIDAIKTKQDTPPPPHAGWEVGIKNGRPTISSPDGRNSIALVGRVQFDVGEYFQNGTRGPSPGDHRISTDLNSGYNLRRGRLGINGVYDNDWAYAFVTEFGSINTSNTQTTGTRVGANVVTGSLLTASLAYNGFRNVSIIAGYTDVDSGFQTAVSSADITFNERASIDAITATLAAGEPRSAFGVKARGDHWYGSGWVTGTANSVPGNGQQAGVVSRGVFIPINQKDALLHFGGNGSYVFSPPRDDTATGNSGNGVPIARTTFRFADRPELRIDPTQFLDTGTINASHAATYGVEVAGKWKAFWANAEYKGIGVNQITSPTGNNPAPFLNFSGYYVDAGYFLTGESRPYSGARAVWDTVVPDAPLGDGGWGAWEIAGRYSYVNLNSGTLGSGGVLGGKQQVYTAAVNWYPVKYIRFMLDYLNAGIDKKAQTTGGGNVAGVTQQGIDFQALVLRTQVSW